MNTIQFDDFKSFYYERKAVLENMYEPKVLRRIHNRFKRGEEIPISYFQDQDNDIKRLFIALPQVSRVITKIEENSEYLVDDGDVMVQIIYGEYGHGKSQTAHLVFDSMINKTENQRVVHLEKITTFRRFLSNFAENLWGTRSKKIRKVVFEIKTQVKSLEAAKESLSLGELIQLFIEVGQELGRAEIPIVIMLDEVDKIVHDEKDLKEWVDFFASMNSAEGVACLIALFVPQKSAQTLLQKDERMLRWSTYLQMEAIFLTGKYGNNLDEGIGNVLAISSTAYPEPLHDSDLSYIHNVIEYRRLSLLEGSLREVNIWTTQILEFISRCSENNLWGRMDIFSKLSTDTQYAKLNTKLRVILDNDDLPTVQISGLEDDQNEVYRIGYSDEAVNVNGRDVSGKYLIHHMGETEYLEYTVPVEVCYTKDIYDASTYSKLVDLIHGSPTIILSMGPKAEQEEEIEREIDNRLGKEQFPYLFCNIPMNIIYPLILVPDESKEFMYLKGLFLIFGTRITSYRSKMEKWFKELPDAMFERQIRIRTNELVGIRPLVKHGSAGGKIREAGVSDINLFLGAFISILESVKRYKQVNVLERQMRKYCETNFINNPEELLKNIENHLDILVKNKLIHVNFQNERNVITKASSWDSEKALQLLQEELTN